ncbi:Transmembrane 9 super member 3 [Bulinus truncatus]|nr:Transmembrane 9 super member 3 [Bulinus truncatus]
MSLGDDTGERLREAACYGDLVSITKLESQGVDINSKNVVNGWFMEPAIITVLGGVLPFGSIFIEMYFIFTSFWAYKIYYVYGFMLLVFLILTIVTVCVTIVCTYFLLNAEDYRWQWTSFMAAASTAGYVYIYSFYYFFFKTKMYGLFQTSFYFGYMALFSLALGVMCGTFGYIGTSLIEVWKYFHLLV